MPVLESTTLILLPVVMLLAAALYASVGHGGASAYLAVMGLVGMAPAEMKPVALVLNIAVSLVALTRFARDGHFHGRLFGLLAVASVPFAFVGGWLGAPDPFFKLILATALVFGCWRLIFSGTNDDGEPVREPGLVVLLALGAGVGFLSGLIGIGGGIFLTPILILCRWSSARQAAGISAAFIFSNSISGLAGFFAKGGTVPGLTWMLLPAVLVGGWAGASWGSRRARIPALRGMLAFVLFVAACKFVMI